MEIIAELALELLGSALSVAVGFAFGAIALAAVVVVRRGLAHVSRSTQVHDPDGAAWSIRVVFGPQQPLTRRLAGMTPAAVRHRRASGRRSADVASDELWHPSRLVDMFDEAVGLVAPFVAVAAVAICILFVVELLIALPVGLALVVASTLRSRWGVEVIDPVGRRSLVTTGSLGDAREAVGQAADRVRAGLDP